MIIKVMRVVNLTVTMD